LHGIGCKEKFDPNVFLLLSFASILRTRGCKTLGCYLLKSWQLHEGKKELQKLFFNFWMRAAKTK
jgi:hypothetical protein